MPRPALLALMWALASTAWAGPAFRAGDLVHIPTAETLQAGRFLATVEGAYTLEDSFHRERTGLTVDVGLTSWLQGGLSWTEPTEEESSRLLWDVRLRVVEEVAGRPGLAIAVGGLGEGKGSRTAGFVLSKELNLPHAGFFSIHAGIRQSLDPTVVDDETDPFGGLEKWWRNRKLRVSAEWDGDTVNAGALIRLGGGVRIGIAVEPDTPRLLFALSLGNGEVLDAIDDAVRLAMRAARLATEGAEE